MTAYPSVYPQEEPYAERHYGACVCCVEEYAGVFASDAAYCLDAPELIPLGRVRCYSSGGERHMHQLYMEREK